MAHYESLAVKSPYVSETTSKDPDAAKTLYVADVPLEKPGRYEMLGHGAAGRPARGRDVGGARARRCCRRRTTRSRAPATSRPAVHTPTRTDVAGDVGKIDTRSPVSDMHEVDFADELGKQPIVLLFATPLLCQSRVCGPVVDLALQVEDEYRDKVKFIHMEVYRDNEVAKGIRPQLGRVQPPVGAVAVRDRPRRQGGQPDGGRLQRRGARRCGQAGVEGVAVCLRAGAVGHERPGIDP